MHTEIIHDSEEDKRQLLRDKGQLRKQIMVMLPGQLQSWFSRVFSRQKEARIGG